MKCVNIGRNRAVAQLCPAADAILCFAADEESGCLDPAVCGQTRRVEGGAHHAGKDVEILYGLFC
jgi:hypothetical protein